MANLVTNNTFNTLANWIAGPTIVATTNTFFGLQAVQVSGTGGFEGGTISQEINLATVAENTTIHIAYRIAAAVDTNTQANHGNANFATWLNTTNTTTGGTIIFDSLINEVSWPLINVGEYYVQEFQWTVTAEAKQAGSIFLIFNFNNGDFEGVGLFTLTDAWFSTNGFCYNEGTQILCINSAGEEEYRAIENIRVGDMVKTYKHGPKPVTHIGKGEMSNSPYNPIHCMYKLPKTGDMIDDLLVLGGHSILVDKYDSEEQEQDCISTMGRVAKIEDKFLLLAKSSPNFIRMPAGEKNTYYHLVLDNTSNDFLHYGIWANGILSESCSEAVFKAHNLTPLE